MKTDWMLLLMSSALLNQAPVRAAAITDEEAVQVTRSVIKADRREIVTRALQLTPGESEKFWPLYDQYRADMDKVGDKLVKLAQDYRMFYPDVPQEPAQRMLKDLASFEKEQASTRAAYLKKFARIVPASKALRFAQLENRLDLALRVELASKIPLVPIEGVITPSTSSSVTRAEGVPGTMVVETHEYSATVTAVDKAHRRLHLLSPEGFQQVVKVGPEAVNFDQIRAGDKLEITATEQLVVRMAEPGDTTDAAKVSLVSLAPRGAKPGGIMAETTQVAATITALDPQKRTATLRFDDGSTHTFPVRPDLDLSKRRVGEKVLIRVTEAVALVVRKP